MHYDLIANLDLGPLFYGYRSKFGVYLNASLTKVIFSIIHLYPLYSHLCTPSSHFFSLPITLSLGFGALVVTGVAFILFKYWKPRSPS